MIPHLDLEALIKTIGYVGVAAMIFAESGLLIGFFLPGDSLLFTAGLLASRGILDIRLLTVLCFVAAVAGDSVGYTFGRQVGRRLFRREDSLFFHKDHLERAQRFYERHGGKTIVLARFLPFIRTFAPIVAGIGIMHYPKFLAYNVIGGFLWAICIPLSGFYLGSLIPGVDQYLLPIIGIIIFISVLPTALHVLRDTTLRHRLVTVVRERIFR